MLRTTLQHRGVIAPVAGERTFLRLANGVRTHFITLVARARVTVTVAGATAVRNRGSVWSLFDEIGIDENGRDVQIYRGPVLRFMSEMSAPSALTAVRAAAPVAVYQLEEACRLYFSHPLSLDPTETSFMERDARAVLNVFVRQTANAAARLYNVGPATVVVDQISVSVIQNLEKPTDTGLARPLFIPTVRQQIIQVNGANPAIIEYIRTANPIRALVLSQEAATDGEVGDIINRYVIRGDYKDIVGPSSMSYADKVLDSEFEYGGAVVSSNRAHLGFNFQRYGKLSEVLNPAQDANIRLELDAQPSAGVGASSVRLTVFELLRDPYVTAEKLPFPV